MPGCFFFVLFVLVVGSGVVFSQVENIVSGCQPYNPEQASLTSPLCAPFISDEVYVPVMQDGIQVVMDAMLFNSSYILISFVRNVLPLGCYKLLMSISCQAAFPTCGIVDFGGRTWEVPVFPCRSVCESALEACASIFSDVSGFTINCSESSQLGGPQWPTGPEYDFPIDGVPVPVECSPTVFPPNASTEFIIPPAGTCPFPLAEMRNPGDSDAVCGIQCPDPSYTHAEWETLRRLVVSMAIISFVLQAFLITSHALLKERRKFPKRVHIYLCICALGFSIAFLLGGNDPFHTTLCNGPADYSTQSTNNRCLAQAIFLVYFGFTSCGWSLILALIAFITVVYELRPEIVAHYEGFFHLFVWFVPVPFILSMLLKKTIAYEEGGFTFCTAVIDVSRTISYDLIFFYIPVAILLGGVVILFSGVIVKLITFRLFHKGSQIDTLKAQRHLFGSVLIVLTLFALIFALRFSTDVKEISRGTTEWALCKVLSELGLVRNDDCTSNTNPHRQSYSLVILQNFATSSVGFWVFLGSGRQKNLYRIWGTIFGHLKRGEYKEIWVLIRYGLKRRKRTISSDSTSRTKPQTSKNDIEMKPTEPPSTAINLDSVAQNDEGEMTNIDLEITPRSDLDTLRSDVSDVD